MTVDSSNLPQLPFERRDLLDVPPKYRELRAEDPITQVRTRAGDVAWLVTSHKLAQQLFADDRLGRSHPAPERAPKISGSVLMGGPSQDYKTERTSSQRLRRLLGPTFAPRRVRAMKPRIQEVVDELIDRMAASTPPVDLHEMLSFPLPVLVICERLGVPYADRDRFREWADALADIAHRDRAAAGGQQFLRYMHQLIQDKRTSPAEDAVTDLISAAEGEGVDDEEIAVTAAGLLLAGHEATVARIDFGTLLLLTHPQQADALRHDPTLVPSAVEEILRMAAPSDHGLTRYAHRDVDIDGVTIRTGDAVLLMRSAANRDERVFPDPERFDITRRPAESHLAFGHGQHYCPGATLARMELQAVFGTLFQRFPTLRLAVPVAELRRPEGRVPAGGLAELPVAW